MVTNGGRGFSTPKIIDFYDSPGLIFTHFFHVGGSLLRKTMGVYDFWYI